MRRNDNQPPITLTAKLQALVYDILPLEEGTGKRCSECDLQRPEAQTVGSGYHNIFVSELRSCVKVEVDVLGSLSMTVRTVSRSNTEASRIQAATHNTDRLS